MINVDNWGRQSQLAKDISKTDTLIKLPLNDGSKFKIPDSDHFYLTLYNGSIREVVKVVSVAGDVLTVDRGQDNTTAVFFPKKSCVVFEWNPAQLCEFLHTCMDGNKKHINPQTLCFSECTCIRVDEGGHIVEVNGGVGC